MMQVVGFWLLCGLFGPSVVWTASVAVSSNEVSNSIDLLMPNVQPTAADTYLCYPMKVDSTYYITGFQPKAKMETVHHILMYGCTKPGNTDGVWDCGEMQSGKEGFRHGPVCNGGSNIVYAWAMDAPELSLPKGVGFKVGDETPINWIVLQVHYKDVTSFLPPNNGRDHSGVTLVTTKVPQRKRAAVYLMGTMGVIPPHSVTYMETACSFNEPIELHPFAFRTHAHTHGRVVSGYRVRDGVWTEIGRKSPQLPQMFYNVTNPEVSVKQGDILAARCTMVNDENITVPIGATSKDEMCNFYMMYYVNGDRIAEENYCFSPGPPEWYWFQLDGLHPENAPLNASIIPGTTDLLKSTQKFVVEMEEAMEKQRLDVEDNLREILEALRGYQRQNEIEESPEEANEVLEPRKSRADDFYQPVNEYNGFEGNNY